MADPLDADARFEDAITGLRRGDFSRLEPLFVGGDTAPILAWLDDGRLAADPAALVEALTCACFLGHTRVAARLLAAGVPPSGGSGTGLDALHWAANRGQLDAVRLLLQWRAPLESRSMYGGTALGTAIWSARHEPRPAHPAIIEALLRAGARTDAVSLPTGDASLDALFENRPREVHMWFKHRAWIPVAWILSLANVVAVWFAARPGEPPWHATTHALLAVLFGLGAQHLATRRAPTPDADVVGRLRELEAMLSDPDSLRGLEGRLAELEERLDFTERALVDVRTRANLPPRE